MTYFAILLVEISMDFYPSKYSMTVMVCYILHFLVKKGGSYLNFQGMKRSKSNFYWWISIEIGIPK